MQQSKCSYKLDDVTWCTPIILLKITYVKYITFYHEEFLFKCYEISVMVIHSTIKPKARKAPLCAVFKSMSFGEPMSFCILLFGFFRQLEFLLYFSSPYCLALMLCLIIMWHNPKVWFQPFSLYFHGFIPKLEI